MTVEGKKKLLDKCPSDVRRPVALHQHSYTASVRVHVRTNGSMTNEWLAAGSRIWMRLSEFDNGGGLGNTP